MKPVYDITLYCDNLTVSMREVTARIVGLSRESAIKHVKELFPAYAIKYVIKMQSMEE